MKDSCDLGYDLQEVCQRYHVIGCHEGYFEELKDKHNLTGYTKDCKYLIKEVNGK